MRHIILSTLFIFACLHAYGQEYVEYDYLKEAAACLEKGDYRCVRSNYNLYQAWQNVDMSAKIQMAEECYKNIIIADNYFNEKEYEKARNHYKTVLDKNPKDSYSKKRYDECVRLLGNNNGTFVGSEILGVAFKELTSETKKQLGISYGVEVTGLTKGKFQEVGIRKGLIIYKINDHPISSQADVEKIMEQLLSSNEQAMFIVGMYSNGKITYYAIDLSE